MSVTTNSLDWIVVIAFEKSDFFDGIENKMDQAFLIGIGVTAIAVYFTGVMAMARIMARAKEEKKDQVSEDLTFFESTRNELLRIYKRTLYQLVKQCKMDPNVLENTAPSAAEEEMAYQFIVDGTRNINILDVFWFLQTGRHASLKSLRVRSSRVLKFCRNLIIYLHLALIFVECPDDELPLHDYISHSFVLFLEFIFIGFHIADLIIMGFTGGFFKTEMTKKQELTRTPKFEEVLRAGLVLALFLDWCYRFFIDDYYWGNNDFLLRLPYTSLLRPFLLIICNKHVMDACKSFAATLFFARDVFIMFGCFLSISAVVGTLLINDSFYEFGHSKIRGFTDSRASFLTMFVFLTSAENYPDIVHPPADRSYYYNIFFFFFSMIGLFLLSSLVIAIFETKYSDRHGQSEKKKINVRRYALISAFIILDKDHSGDLTVDEFKNFLGSSITFKDNNLALNIMEFVELIEQIIDRLDDSAEKSKERTKRKHGSAPDPKKLITRMRNWLIDYYSSIVHRRFMLFITITYMWILSLYGIYNTSTLDYIAISFLLLFVLEVVGRVFAFGWIRFWYRHDDVYMEMGNRYDFIVTLIAVIAYLCSAFFEGTIDFEEEDPSRAILAVPLFRVFSSVESIKMLFFAMVRTVGVFGDVGILLLVIFYVFGAIGTVAFGGQISQLDDETYEMLTANFDSTLKTLGTLFQLMVGEAWSSVMYAGIDAVGMMSMIYFVLWTLIISLLFTNLIVGIVCNSFEKVDDLRKKKGDDRISTVEMADSLKDGSLSSMIRFLKVIVPLDPEDPVELIRTLTPGNLFV
eukprot:TRINITY_DN553_c0_g1_i9.p1 TRINITY_DN553_c0_g1~~TRINITY_DN553_c0_g1_i9.p1  ORF type:complete len:804 (+),score=163.35 TRINITY_DN553_c0_g1_i9:711-3122(+)